MPFGEIMLQMGKTYKTILFLLITLCTAQAVQAQKYYTGTEVGISGGGSQYFGDLNENYGYKTIHVNGGIYARKRMNMYIAVKAVVNYTNVGYDDKLNSDLYDRTRNLNFKSEIIEGALQAEFNFFGFVTGDPTHRFTPYLTGGIGAFYYSPYTTYNGQKYSLQPQGTEGQNTSTYKNRKYGSTAACFPIGIGAKFWITGGVNLTLEIADRLTTTDHMDDVNSTYVGINNFKPNSAAAALQDRSGETGQTTKLGVAGKQRGNTSSMDQYMLAEISLSFNFTSYRCPSADRNDDQLRIR